MQGDNASKAVYSDGEIFTRRAMVSGFSQFDGSDEFQASYAVHIRVNLKPPLGKGARTEARPCVDKAVIERIQALPFERGDIECDVSMVELASKRKTALTVVDVRPVSKAAKAA